MDLKLKHFETLEAMLDQERRDLQAERTRLYCERLAFRKVVISRQTDVRNGSSFAGVEGVEQEANGKMVEYSEMETEMLQLE
jgi:SWI/SNF related-matrix-associated actin-dependent regulator of chromatin subfamily C